MQWSRTLGCVGTILLAASMSCLGATVYRWADAEGKVHYSEVVPERYRSVARPVDATANEPSVEQQRQASERARAEKAKAAALASGRRSLPMAAAPASSASGPLKKRPVQIPNDQTDCETWQRLYMESVECFGPYRTTRGATKPEAFEVCNAVPAPPVGRCRMQIP
jgi:hypothetical protein